MTSVPTTTYELHSRSGDGIHVQLLWRPRDEHLFVAVTDRKQGQEFCVEVRDRAHALDVFHHPFAYAAHYDVQANTTRADVRLAASASR